MLIEQSQARLAKKRLEKAQEHVITCQEGLRSALGTCERVAANINIHAAAIELRKLMEE